MTYYSSPPVSDWHHQFIIGTILGGSTVVKPSKGKNCYLFMRSSNKDWLMYKSTELTEFASEKPISQDGSTLRWHSNCYPVFTAYRDMFYKNKDKYVSMETLDTLKDIGLAIWYGDCGHVKKGCVIINTCKFREEGSKTIAQYFNEVGFEASMGVERGSHRVIMSKTGTEKFLMTIGHCLPSFLQDQLQEEA